MLQQVPSIATDWVLQPWLLATSFVAVCGYPALSFNDENPTEQLWQIAIANPGKRVYLSGTLTVDYPEGITLRSAGRQNKMAAFFGETLTLEMHPLELGVLQLSNQ